MVPWTRLQITALAKNLEDFRKYLDPLVQKATDVFYIGKGKTQTGWFASPEHSVDWDIGFDGDRTKIGIRWEEFSQCGTDRGDEIFDLDFVLNEKGEHDAYLAECEKEQEKNKAKELDNKLAAAINAKKQAEATLAELEGKYKSVEVRPLDPQHQAEISQRMKELGLSK